MDFIDHESGRSEENFWFRAKSDLTRVLMTGVEKPAKILNVGAGTGGELSMLNKFGSNYVVDVNKNALDLIGSGMCVEKKVADACSLPYADSYFDAVVSLDVFEHIENDGQAVSEAWRVLKKGGTLVFTVPAFQFLFSSHDRALEHKRRYNKKMLRTLLRNFSDVKLFYWNSSLFVPAALMRIARKKSGAAADNSDFPPVVNNILYGMLKAENALVGRHIRMPFGLTIAGICRK